MMRPVFSRYIARFAIFIVLFAALSPALAALRLQDRPDLLAELCTAAGIKRVADHSAPGQNQKAHNIYCVLCLASAQYAAPGVDVHTQPHRAADFETAPALVISQRESGRAAAYFSRGPPSPDLI